MKLALAVTAFLGLFLYGIGAETVQQPDLMKKDSILLEKATAPVCKEAAVAPKGCCQKQKMDCSQPCPITGKKEMTKEECQKAKCPVKKEEK